ncbi:type I-E CRISPR-associated protein Cse1/CasA [Cellulomonas bogoriensis]|uniref:CRISPR-associated protein Cse1 n=1 Tax=Cellulomonas bogoriensis 69B4 = DSM 16987 TaxID=1386082 RepID=A0A0A0C2Q2_9CELL|nr:type I-E CRISPR-associated protein Cse1/CasA [Cellulomonas bogoriensis]KGM13639.1 CRISPR-associated protein Cse1 [Cellulomonas bogoriensis 69B4 = DSM 16987]
MSTSTSGFSLIDEPWVLVRTREGSTDEVSLRELFARAPALAEVVGDLPTQAFAILRLALAVVHRAVDGPRDEYHWQELWDSGSPPMDLVDAYLDRFRDRFDLFHPRTPFFQVADLQTAKGGFSGLEKLIADVPAGSQLFTSRAGQGLERLSPAEAARWLVHLQAFDISGIKSGALGDPRVKGGKGYPIGVGWTGNIGGLAVQGDDLWRTVLLNLVAHDQPVLADFSPSDAPAWERPPDTAAEDPDLASRPAGPTDLYTWQSRRVLLQGGTDGVTGVLVANGDKLTPQNRWRAEPMTAWRRSAPQEKKLGLPLVYMPQELDPSRALWRGLSSLLPAVAPRGKADGGEPHVTAGVVAWAAQVLERRSRVTVHATGMQYGTQNAMVDEIVDDRLRLSVAVLAVHDPALPQAALDAINAAEEGVKAVQRLAADLARAAGAGDDLAKAARARVAEQAYAGLDAPFRSWLGSLDDGTDPESARVGWHVTARRHLHRLGDDLVHAAGPAAWVGREVMGGRVSTPQADGRFRRALMEALPVPEERPTEEVGA